jgi:hypothetical protein
MFFLGLAGIAVAQSESQGPFCGRTYLSSAANHGSLFWVNASGARCDEDDARTATDRIGKDQYTQYLQISDFSFDIPRDARITGIEVVVIRRADQPDAIHDRSVRLVRGDVVAGKNNAVAEPWDSEWTAVYYGGENDQWGQQWTPADLNRPDFGIVVDVQFGTAAAQPQIDEVLVTVHYAPRNKNVHTVNLARAPSKYTCYGLGS